MIVFVCFLFARILAFYFSTLMSETLLVLYTIYGVCGFGWVLHLVLSGHPRRCVFQLHVVFL
jgi:hypothetical protein